MSELQQNLKESERKKEESLVKVDSLQSAVAHLEEERAALGGKLRDVQQEMNELRDQKRLLEERLNNAETELTLQVSKRYCYFYFSWGKKDCPIYRTRWKLGLESRDGAVVRALAASQCGLGTIPASAIYVD